MEVTNSELPQEFSIFYFDCGSPKNPYTLYLHVVGITQSPNITTTNKLDLCNYDENDEEDKDKWEVDSDGEVDPFFNAIADEKDFDDD